MNAAVVQDRASVPALKDGKLFRDRAYVDGAWVEADSKGRFDVDNPGDGSIIGSVPDMGAAEARRAILAAQAALPVMSGPAMRRAAARERSDGLPKIGLAGT